MDLPTVVSREQWLVARKELLAKEKAATRAKDAVNTERRELPMVRVGKNYVFDSAEGKRSLLDLFDGRHQLIIYHAMWLFDDDQLCPSCSLLIDGLPHLSHLHARNTTLSVVARGPLAKLCEYWQRMGWTVPVVSSAGSDFNWDFNVTVDPSVRPAEYNFAQWTATGLASCPAPVFSCATVTPSSTPTPATPAAAMSRSVPTPTWT